MRDDCSVPIQPSREIDPDLSDRLVGTSLRALQVLGINTLKTVQPPTNAVLGEKVIAVDVAGRQVHISTAEHRLVIDLARTGRISYLDVAEPWSPADRTQAPTIRLLLDNGGGIDFSEPAKTKRITLSIRGLR
jgi:hypothetical protein